MRVLLPLLLLLALAGTGLSAQDRIQPARRPSIWISREQVRALPDSGPEWDRMLLDANRPLVPDIENKDDRTDAWVLAASLVWVREGALQYRDRVREACALVAQAVPPAENDPPNDRSLAWARNLTGYILAADLVGLDVALDTVFRARLRAALPHLRRVHRTRPNNIGTHAGTARVAIALYLGDEAEEQASWDVFRRWLGDDTSPFNFDQASWGGSKCAWQWQGEPYPRFFGINRAGTLGLACTKIARYPRQPAVLRDISGALPDDQRRADPDCSCPFVPGACCFDWPPPKTNYVYEALQGVLAQAVIHSRRGRDPWTISPDPVHGHGAILRAFEWLRDVAMQPIADPVNGHDDYWQAYVVNQVYAGTEGFVPLPELTTSAVGKSVAYADWTTLEPSWP